MSEICSLSEKSLNQNRDRLPKCNRKVLLQVKVLASEAAKTEDSSQQSRLHCELFSLFGVGVKMEVLQKSWSQKHTKTRILRRIAGILVRSNQRKSNFRCTCILIRWSKWKCSTNQITVPLKQNFWRKRFDFTVAICRANVRRFLAPQLSAMVDGIIKGTEQRLSRGLFKVAVELGAVTHLLAAVHEVDDDTLRKLRAMCVDEVKRINGVINFEKAVRYQRRDE